MTECAVVERHTHANLRVSACPNEAAYPAPSSKHSTPRLTSAIRPTGPSPADCRARTTDAGAEPVGELPTATHKPAMDGRRRIPDVGASAKGIIGVARSRRAARSAPPCKASGRWPRRNPPVLELVPLSTRGNRQSDYLRFSPPPDQPLTGNQLRLRIAPSQAVRERRARGNPPVQLSKPTR